jgi:DNA-binding CsgD family transcriptional regulator
LVCLSVAVFLLAASPGYLDWYYSDVSLIFINGMAKLEKVYGPLHSVYLIYLLVYMGLMAGTILTSRVKRKTVSQKHAILLMVVTFLNIAIWGVEQLIYTEFELLSVSYIVSELLLLLLYGMMQDYGILSDSEKEPVPVFASIAPVAEDPFPEPVAAVEASADAEEENHAVLDNERILLLAEKWKQEYTLTTRETQVLIALLQNKRRKEIALDMEVTEHTVKKHTGNIFSKLEVTSRTELFALADQA